MKPGQGGGVSVNEKTLAGCGLEDVVEEDFAGGVGGEVEMFDAGTNGRFGLVWVQLDFLAAWGGPESASRGIGIAVADKKDPVFFSIQEGGGETVGGGPEGHHAGGEQVEVTPFGAKISQGAPIENLGANVFGEAGLVGKTIGGVRQAIIDFREGTAKSADEKGIVGNLPALAGFVQQGEKLLSFAHGKDWEEGGPPCVIDLIEGLNEAVPDGIA